MLDVPKEEQGILFGLYLANQMSESCIYVVLILLDVSRGDSFWYCKRYFGVILGIPDWVDCILFGRILSFPKWVKDIFLGCYHPKCGRGIPNMTLFSF